MPENWEVGYGDDEDSDDDFGGDDEDSGDDSW